MSSTLQWVSRADTVEAEKALLLGPVRVIPREYSNVRCQSIDVVYPQDDVARDRILTQLVAEIGVRDSIRWSHIAERIATFRRFRPFVSRSRCDRRRAFAVEACI